MASRASASKAWKAEVARLKATTASGFYCGKCRTRDRARCSCRPGCVVCSQPSVSVEPEPRCEDHRWIGASVEVDHG